MQTVTIGQWYYHQKIIFVLHLKMGWNKKKKMLVWLSIWKNILKKDRKTMKLRYRTIKMVMLLD